MNPRKTIQTFLVPALLGAALLAQAVPAAAQVADAGTPPAAGECHGHHHGEARGDGAFDMGRFAQHWQGRAQRLSQRLGLDARQQQALGAIVQTELTRFQQTVSTLPPHSPERHAARLALMQDFDTRLTAILSPVQRTQWAQAKEEMRAHFEEHHGFGDHGGVF